MINEKKYENASLVREKNTLTKNVQDLTNLNIEKDNMVCLLEGEILELKNNIAECENQIDDHKSHIDEQNFQIEDLNQQCKHWEGKYENENTVLIQAQNDIMELQSGNYNMNGELESEQKKSNFYNF